MTEEYYRFVSGVLHRDLMKNIIHAAKIANFALIVGARHRLWISVAVLYEFISLLRLGQKNC